MKAITLRQPWATLVAFGFKTIETRTWPAPLDLIGERIAIHAAGPGRIPRRFHTLPLGCVVATAVLADVLPMVGQGEGTPDGWPVQWPFLEVTPNALHHWPYDGADDAEDATAQRPFGDYQPGMYAWLLEGVEPFDRPIKATGRQGFWEWTP